MCRCSRIKGTRKYQVDKVKTFHVCINFGGQTDMVFSVTICNKTGELDTKSFANQIRKQYEIDNATTMYFKSIVEVKS